MDCQKLAIHLLPLPLGMAHHAVIFVSGNSGLRRDVRARRGCRLKTAHAPQWHCICYTATKTSLHTATGGLVTIPPGKTVVAVSVDQTDKTSSPGCRPAWGEIQYTQTGGSDSATIEFFASLCQALAPTSPQSFSGGGALTSATLDVPPFGDISGITGFGTATGTYSAAATGSNLTLNLTAVISP